MNRTATGRRRGLWYTAIATGSVAVVAVVFGLGTLVQSPWREASANSGREPLVTVPVEHRTLAADIEDASAVYSAGRDLVIGAPDVEGAAVVTAQKVRAGQKVVSGSVLSEVSGRPIFGLATPFRLYRNVSPGASGPDVRALQEALAELGLYGGVRDGVYGAGTAGAVKSLYQRHGYSVPIERELLDAVDAAEAALADAERVTEPGAGGAGAGGEAGATQSPQSANPRAEEALKKARFVALTPLRAAEFARLPVGGATVLSAAGVGSELGGGGSAESADTDAGGSQAGDAAAGDLVKLRIGEPRVIVRIGVASKGAFGKGASAEVRSVADQRKRAMAVVAAVSEFRHSAGDGAQAIPGYDVTLHFNSEPPFEDGDAVMVASRATAPTKARGLAVPITALRSDPTGTYVVVLGHGRVAVSVIGTGDGYAVVTAKALSAGDDVVISGDSRTSTVGKSPQ